MGTNAPREEGPRVRVVGNPIHVLRLGSPHAGSRDVAARLADIFKLDSLPTPDIGEAGPPEQEWDAVLVDPSHLEGSDRITWTRRALQHIGREFRIARPVALVDPDDTELARVALAAGAWTVVPPDATLVADRLTAAARLCRLARPARCGCAVEDDRAASSTLIGESEAIERVRRDIERVARSDVPVLITGASGTGKELAAVEIHAKSRRSDGPFVAINCGAIPEALLESEFFGSERGAFTGASRARQGRIRAAAGGTLFLDEVGELAPRLQSKVLRFLQDHKVEAVGSRRPVSADVRVLAATNRDLRSAIGDGGFREDLFYRLAVFELAMPGLAERGDDVVLLARHFLECYGREATGRVAHSHLGFGPDAVEALRSAEWPGNVRELINRVRRALLVAEGPSISAADLGWDAATCGPTTRLRETRRVAEASCIRTALRIHDGRKRETARALGISRTRLYELMRSYGISDQQ